ncbi:hypothetical protein [Ranid herpesvirus 3]|uniref:Uncharacterized protein n=1 Tax=Ranid herpesvirus 3 TaxID=1987509 RepID=A0A1X9T5C8_9VIRU|nr:hypothetical protein [Ranid herpesvirus 3]ARR28903.1 hypothetical protein [Ranid herpesvirus 3]
MSASFVRSSSRVFIVPAKTRWEVLRLSESLLRFLAASSHFFNNSTCELTGKDCPLSCKAFLILCSSAFAYLSWRFAIHFLNLNRLSVREIDRAELIWLIASASSSTNPIKAAV